MAHPGTEAGTQEAPIEVTDVESAALAYEQRQQESIEPGMVIEGEAEEVETEEVEEIESAEEEVEETEIEQDEEELPEAIPAPVSMSNEDAAYFNEAPPEIQKWMVQREAERDKGLQQKTVELAEQRKALDEQFAQTQQERLKYAKQLETQMLDALPPKPSAELLNPESEYYNPGQYQFLEAKHREALAQQQQLQQQHQSIVEAQAADEKKQLEDIAANRDSVLSQTLPEWIKPEFQDSLKEYAKSGGHDVSMMDYASPEEITTLNKARLYDELMAKKPEVKKQLEGKPKHIKAGAKAQGTTKARKIKELKQRVKQTGSIEDAVALYEARQRTG